MNIGGYVTYEDACEAIFSRREARFHILDHNCSWTEFIEECGKKDTYTGQEILDWLGY